MRSLYLDTARLGQMSPGAVEALTDFVRLTAEEPSGLYFEKFLKDGIDAWPESFGRCFPGLNCWQGIAALKQSLLSLVGSPPDGQVLLASRSAQLMELAAISQFRVCRRVLTTDLNWPAYQEILRREAVRTGGSVDVIPLRRSLLFDRMSETELVRHLTGEYAGRGCDGLFLPAVDNLGVRLPVASIVRSIKSTSRIAFTVVDGAQAIGHVPLDLDDDCYDLLVAGCHKWIRGYLPMGLAFYSNHRSRSLVDQIVKSTLHSRRLDDPLLRFVRQIEADDTDGYLETTNISPLFSCAGALRDLEPSATTIEERTSIRVSNARRVLNVAHPTRWNPLLPDDGLRSGVVLVQSQRNAVRHAASDVIREAFRHAGVSVSNYDAGLARLSMPDEPLPTQALNRVRDALLSVN